MNRPQSKYGAASIIRVAVLVIVVGTVGVFLYVDNTVTMPKTNKTLDQLMAACEGTKSIGSDEVQKITGFAPSASEDKGDNVILETYHFKRSIPFLTSATAYALYQGGGLKKIVANRELTQEDIDYVRFFNQ